MAARLSGRFKMAAKSEKLSHEPPQEHMTVDEFRATPGLDVALSDLYGAT
jgi:hypothetical protein